MASRTGRSLGAALAPALALTIAAVGLAPAVAAQANLRIVAHRGDSQRAPENTLAAIRSAGVHADEVEFDVRATSDGHLVLMHDSTVDRTTNGTGAVTSMTLATLRTLDAGSWFAPGFAGERIPTLDEAIITALSHQLRPMIERKAGDPAQFVAALRRLGATRSVTVASFDWAFMFSLEQLEPAVHTACIGGGLLDANVLQAVSAVGAAAISWRHNEFTAADVALVHGARLELYAWTANTTGAVRRLVNLGVDGVVSDVPDLVGLLRGARPPPPIPFGLARLHVDHPTTKSPTVTVAHARKGFPLQVPAANLGDYDLGVGPGFLGLSGEPLMQERGVAIANVAELGGNHGALEAPGLNTDSLGGNTSNGGIWIAGSDQGGGEHNFATTLAWFPFAEGWIGGHVNGDGHVLAAGNLPTGARVSRTGTGRYHLVLPGIESRSDGVLFAIGASNEDNRVAAAPRPGGNGWDVAVRDNSHDFADGEDDDWSFVYAPFSAPTQIVGRVAGDGEPAGGSGAWSVDRIGAGRYALVIPGVDDERDGALVLAVTQAAAGTAEDNTCAYAFDPVLRAYLIETRDLPGGALQDTGFAFAFTSFGTPAVEPFGVGCPGFGNRVPVLGSAHLPFVGNQAFDVALDAGRPFAPAVLAGSFWHAALPIHLGSGCSVYLDPSTPPGSFVIPGPAMLSALGSTRFPLPVPDNRALLGSQLFLQALILDNWTAAGLVTTRALQLRL